MEPVHYLRVLRRRRRLIVALTLLGIAAGLGSYYLADDSGSDDTIYAAIATLEADAASPGEAQQAINWPQLANHADGPDIAERVAERLDADPDELRAQIYPVPNGVLSTLEVSAIGSNPEQVEELAEVWAEQLLGYEDEQAQDQRDREIAVQQETVDDLQERYDNLDAQIDANPGDVLIETQLEQTATEYSAAQSKLDTLRSSPLSTLPLSIEGSPSAAEISSARYLSLLAAAEEQTQSQGKNATASDSARDLQEKASNPGGSSGPGPATRAGVGGMTGLVLGILLVLVLDRLDPRVHTKEDVEEAYDLPVLTEVPALTRAQLRSTDLMSWDQPRSRVTEAYRALRSAVLFSQTSSNGADGAEDGNGASSPEGSNGHHRAKVILVSSPGPSEGKTTVTANLAAVMAEAGLDVLVLNCDFRRPRIHQYFHTPYEPRKVQATQVPGVRLVADVVSEADNANPAEVIRAQEHVIRTARDMVDIIILDTAPLLTTNDASELLSTADSVLMVAQAGRTTHEACFRAGELLERRKANAIGAVVLNVEGTPTSRYYYYYRGSGKYYNDDKDTSSRRRDSEGSSRGADSRERVPSPASGPDPEGRDGDLDFR